MGHCLCAFMQTSHIKHVIVLLHNMALVYSFITAIKE